MEQAQKMVNKELYQKLRDAAMSGDYTVEELRNAAESQLVEFTRRRSSAWFATNREDIDKFKSEFRVRDAAEYADRYDVFHAEEEKP